MFYYAQLNEHGVCVGISSLSGEVRKENMIQINEFNQDYLWKKFENGAWSTAKFEPISTAPIDEFTQLQLDNEMLKMLVADLGLMVGGGL